MMGLRNKTYDWMP